MSDHDLSPVEREAAEELLAQVDLVQSQVRWSLLASNWWFFLLWGAIVLGSVVHTLFLGGDTGPYWIVAGPLGAIVSFFFGLRTGYDVGPVQSAWPYVGIAAAIFAGTWGSSVLLSGTAAITGVFVSLAIGFSLFSLLDRQTGPVTVFVVLIMLAVALSLRVDDAMTLYLMNSIAFGMAFVSMGLSLGVGRPMRAGGRR